MTDLLTRLEAAKEGDRELDAEIWFRRAATSDCPIEQGFENCGGVRLRWWRKGSVGLWDNELPHYTTSRDAITELIERELPGWKRLSCSDGMALLWKGKDTSVTHIAPTECLALCIAFVKAKEATDV